MQGFILGLVAAIILALIFRIVRFHWGEFTRMLRPQVIVHKTERTPWDVVWGAVWRLGLVVLFMALIAAVRDPERSGDLGSLLGATLRVVASLLVTVFQTLWNVFMMLVRWAIELIG